MLSEIIAKILKERHRQAGLTLDVTDDHMTYLKHGDRIVCVFGPQGSIAEMQKAADEFVIEQQVNLIEDALDEFARFVDDRTQTETNWYDKYDREDIKAWLRQRMTAEVAQ